MTEENASERPPLRRIAITGATGLVGAAASERLRAGGWEVLPISRGRHAGSIRWDPGAGYLDRDSLEGTDAVLHLAGEPIAQRWTGRAREKIYSSRVESTRLLVQTLSQLQRPPQVLLSASGINYYASTGMGARVDETAPNGNSFLARVCRHWEAQALLAEESGIRTCLLRTAVVLSPQGGALAKLLPVFRAGLGGPVGSGRQPFPWIALDDHVGATLHLLDQPDCRGPFNLVAPGMVDNRTFSRSLAAQLRRPSLVPVPRLAVGAVFGEMGRATLLEGVDARPAALEASGYSFRFPALDEALAHLLA
jgi:uncharacterized protein (TIGR01777 family)